MIYAGKEYPNVSLADMEAMVVTASKDWAKQISLGFWWDLGIKDTLSPALWEQCTKILTETVKKEQNGENLPKCAV